MTGTAGTSPSEIPIEQAPDHSAAASARPRALVSRTMDFWLLGGASIFLWILVRASLPFRAQSWAISHHFGNLLAISGTAALVCNYPHFMASYKLAYGQGARYVARHWWQLVVVPLVLVGLCVLGYRLFDNGTTSAPAFVAVNTLLNVIPGVRTSIGVGQTSGATLIGLLLNLMYFTVGWHYSKQVYGCMMVQGAFDEYRLTDGQKRLLRWSNHSIWIANWVYLNSVLLAGKEFHWSRSEWNTWYGSLGFANWVLRVTMVVWGASVVAVAVFIVLRNWRQRRQLPSPNWLVPYIAFTVWWLPYLYQFEYTTFIVPFFHSLQYLAFVYKIESRRLHATSVANPGFRGGMIAIALFVTGWLSFDLLPNLADNHWVHKGMITGVMTQFFLVAVAATIFINVHHYFIDNVIWRFTNKRVKEYLIA